MSEFESGQVTASAARIYDEYFILALNLEWAPRVVRAAAIKHGDSILDVACGTGLVAGLAAEHVGKTGMVAGVDLNRPMIDRAVANGTGTNWALARSEALPFADESFHSVVSQFGLMYFQDKEQSLKEMARVLSGNGRLVVTVWASLNDTPAYRELVNLLELIIGVEVAEGLRIPYSLGDLERVRTLLTQSGLLDAVIRTIEGTARFPSIAKWIETDVKGWTMAEHVSPQLYEKLLDRGASHLKPFTRENGSVQFRAPAHIIIWTKP